MAAGYLCQIWGFSYLSKHNIELDFKTSGVEWVAFLFCLQLQVDIRDSWYEKTNENLDLLDVSPEGVS